MLQWMGGSRRKVTTTRKSTQKRQKQYFEQRRRQQQNLQIMGSESSSDVLGVSGQYLNEHRSLDILNLLNLSTNAQECYSPCVEESTDAKANISTMPGKILKNQPMVFLSMATSVESSRTEEARAPPVSRMDATQKKPLESAPDYQNGALSGIPCMSTNSMTAVTDQYVGLSVIDLLYDDGPKITVEEHPTFEDHVAFSLEGLGKVAAETPPQSPQQPSRISYSYSQLLKDEKKKKLSKAINHELEDLELEVYRTGIRAYLWPPKVPETRSTERFTELGSRLEDILVQLQQNATDIDDLKSSVARIEACLGDLAARLPHVPPVGSIPLTSSSSTPSRDIPALQFSSLGTTSHHYFPLTKLSRVEFLTALWPHQCPGYIPCSYEFFV